MAMEENYKCIKVTREEANEQELEAGMRCIKKWYITKKGKTQKCGPESPHPWYEDVMEDHDLSLDRLIFFEGKCIGVYFEEMIFLFDVRDTHFQKKYLGEIPTSHDQSISFYSYYYLSTRM